MNDEDLHDLMCADDGALPQSDELRDSIFAETESVLRRRRVRRRGLALASLTVWTAAAFLVGRASTSQHSPRPPLSPAPAHTDVMDAPSEGVVARGPTEQTTDLLSLGDERARRGDMAAALDFYRRYLAGASDEERRPNQDDTWLLASLKMELD